MSRRQTPICEATQGQCVSINTCFFYGHFTTIGLLPHQACYGIGNRSIIIFDEKRGIDGIIGVFAECRRIVTRLSCIWQFEHGF